MSTKILNLTPHELRIRKLDGSFRTVPPSGVVARAAMVREKADVLDGVQTRNSEIGPPEWVDLEGNPTSYPTDLPGDAIAVVSRVAWDAISAVGWSTKRAYVPGAPIRDDEGRVIGCDGLDWPGGVE